MRWNMLGSFVAAALAAFVAADVPDIPRWLDALLVALITGFAAVGLEPIRSSRAKSEGGYGLVEIMAAAFFAVLIVILLLAGLDGNL